MKKEYGIACDCSLELLKNYLFKWIKDEKILVDVAVMLNKQEIINYIMKYRDDIYEIAIDYLYGCKDYESLEEGIIVMNTLFNHEAYLNVKEDLYYKLIKQPICLDSYLVLRHLIPFHHISQLLVFISKELIISLEDYARICIIENEYDEALRCLNQLNDCPNELLDVVASYSLWDYYKLKKQSHMSRRLELDFVH